MLLPKLLIVNAFKKAVWTFLNKLDKVSRNLFEKMPKGHVFLSLNPIFLMTHTRSHNKNMHIQQINKKNISGAFQAAVQHYLSRLSPKKLLESMLQDDTKENLE